MKQILRPVLFFCGLFLALYGLSRIVRIAPDWTLWIIALVGALIAEGLVRLYRYESGAVSPRRAKALVALRLIGLAILGFILIEPTWVRKVKREVEQEVIILLDDSASMGLVDEGEKKNRAEIGADALAKSNLEKELKGRLRVRTLHTARSVKVEGETAGEGWQDSTDLASALGTILEQVPPDELAGVIMLTDGRHNRPARVEDTARRYGILDAPIGIVALGSASPPKDASIISIKAPEAIHLGDRMRVNVETIFQGYRGQVAKVTLFQGGKSLETRDVRIPQDSHREEIRFAQLPEEGGVNEYHVEISGLEGERFADNNSWNFETSITDARTHVLIVEGYPRWEFRYLRNLFYGRDKSVHLQHVLLNPDRIANQNDAAIPASADRPFGDAGATRLPVNESEWKKFDVIIIGDVEPAAINAPTWDIISRCVNDRAAMLVMVSGPRFMPHGLTSPSAQALVPAVMEWGKRTYFENSESPFRFGLTAEGLRHPVTQQSIGESANGQVWEQFPEITWRHPIKKIKDGAEVLLTAVSSESPSETRNSADLQNALKALGQRKQREADNALLVTRQTGKGKVALLLTDRTWRLREGAGDIFHHRFWGNLLQWGAGPTLRAGGKHARLGTDQLGYTPDDKPKIIARLRNSDLTPVTDAEPKAEVIDEDGKLVAKMPMTAVNGSEGLYEVTLDRFKNTGRYHIRIVGKGVKKLLGQDGVDELKTGFRVISSRGPIELAETTINLPLMQTIADLSGGKVVKPDQISELKNLFISDEEDVYEVRETSLWDNPWLFGLFALVLTGEWVMRRSGGLPWSHDPVRSPFLKIPYFRIAMRRGCH
ncbi:MAG: hypothetical protein H7Y36_01855 [Armatimonadetes bacterium]|nr:hypothetical protein [Akkermansiaceae bacterium]